MIIIIIQTQIKNEEIKQRGRTKATKEQKNREKKRRDDPSEAAEPR